MHNKEGRKKQRGKGNNNEKERKQGKQVRKQGSREWGRK